MARALETSPQSNSTPAKADFTSAHTPLSPTVVRSSYSARFFRSLSRLFRPATTAVQGGLAPYVAPHDGYDDNAPIANTRSGAAVKPGFTGIPNQPGRR